MERKHIELTSAERNELEQFTKTGYVASDWSTVQKLFLPLIHQKAETHRNRKA